MRGVATACSEADSAPMRPIDPAQPFVMLDDARADGGKISLYRNAAEIIVATAPEELAPALARMKAARAQGAHLAGYMSYEAGLVLEPRLGGLAETACASGTPLLWFGVFEQFEAVDATMLPGLLGDPAGAWTGTLKPRISYESYAAVVERALGYIAAGDIYQANLTFRADVAIHGDPRALYARLRAASTAGWGGIVHNGRHWLLSCSPELFFTIEDGVLTARPMKGTAPIDADPALFRDDPKERAENLMIVDLIRNDVSRVAVPGSVEVPRLFEVERYPTVLQMTSTVTAKVARERDAVDVLATLFPCGSITGAPKIRAMEIIAELETDPRGVYTGAIGAISPKGDAAFNVAIRTLIIGLDRTRATLGLGSGIVADSSPEAEWRECLAKGAFVTAEAQPFDLIETMRFDADEGVCELDRHIARMKASATALEFTFDRHALRNDLQAATFRVREPSRIRVRLSKSGATAIEVRAIPPTPDDPIVTLAPLPVARDDFRLAHKTSDRDFYDDARARAKSFEVIFVDDEGFLTEGSFTNIFVERDGTLITPPLSRGLLPGILREKLIDEGKALEGDLKPADLYDGFYVGNVLRGLIRARLVAGAEVAGL
jgi:para-aminobenzoate synthetase/4-amino-4-deoxychorismate lyase